MIVSLGYDRFRVVTATWGFFPLCGFFLFCVFVRSLLYLVWATSRELPVLYIEHPHRYHHIREPPPTCFSPCFAPLPTLPQLSLGCERAAIRVSLSHPDGKLVETWWSQKGGWQSWNMHDAAALGVSAVSNSENIYVFFQDRTEYLSALSLNGFASKWQFTAII